MAIAQAADFLYAPTDYILINWLINPQTVAVYAPAVQIDSGLQLMVTGLAAVLLPHSALAHAAGDRSAVRRYYLRGTAAGIALLIPAAVIIWLAAPLILRLWLGRTMSQTLAILPIVLLNTVVGGSSAVGRSVLLAMGKVNAFSASVVAAGIANVILSFVFVRFCNLGLTGILLGTIVAVVGRCDLDALVCTEVIEGSGQPGSVATQVALKAGQQRPAACYRNDPPLPHQEFDPKCAATTRLIFPPRSTPTDVPPNG